MINKKKVYYFGNPYIKEDSLAVRVVENLKKELDYFDFIHIKDTFQLMDVNLSDTVLIDVVQSINEVCVLNAKDIKSKGASTTHDFDLGFYLKLSGQEAKIIGIPMEYDEDKAIEEVKKIILPFA